MIFTRRRLLSLMPAAAIAPALPKLSEPKPIAEIFFSEPSPVLQNLAEAQRYWVVQINRTFCIPAHLLNGQAERYTGVLEFQIPGLELQIGDYIEVNGELGRVVGEKLNVEPEKQSG